MTSPAVPVVPGPRGRRRCRQRDRREGAMLLVSTLTPALRQADGRLARLMFEESIRRLVGATRVHLREHVPGAVPALTDAVRLAVPVSEPPDVLLEAAAPAGERFDAWDVQLLNTASHLAALVIDAERTRSRTALAPTELSDGAAALVGSTESMKALRETIARVAATDFTILIEGGIAR